MRHDGRFQRELRQVKIQTNPNLYTKGSVSLKIGNTKVLCSATLEEKIQEKEGKKLAVTYQFLPTAYQTRRSLETAKTAEVQQFLENNLVKLLDETLLVKKQLILDVVVLQSDGGEIAACFNGCLLALKLLIRQLCQEGKLTTSPLQEECVAISCGLLNNGQVAVDLDASEEQVALGQMNFLVTKEGDFFEIISQQVKRPLTSDELNAFLFYSTTAAKEYFSYLEASFEKEITQKEANTLVVATKNPGKAKEFAQLFAPLGFQVKTLLDFPNLPDIPETGKTFEENARLKAEGIAAILNQVVIADDSGLMVDALDHLPGIYSARFAGPDKNDASNNAKLLATLASVPKGKRQAQFYCALAVAAPFKKTLTVHGLWEGEIATLPQGEAGFGYDPLFYIPNLKKTAAQLSEEEKNHYSHRGQALKALANHWKNWWKGETDEIHRSK